MKTKGPVDLSRAAVINVDIQNAFGKNAQAEALSALRDTEDAEIQNAARLSEAAHAAGGVVIVTKDLHNKVGTKLSDGKIDNRSQGEFDIYGEHALTGSKDAELNAPLEQSIQKLEAAEGKQRTIIPVDQYDATGQTGSGRIIEVHKNIYDVTKRVDVDGETRTNQGFIGLLAKLQDEGVDTAIITGKIAEVCVSAAANSISELFPNLNIVVVEDAVSAMPTEIAKSIPGLEPKENVMAGLKAANVQVVQMSQILPSSAFICDGVNGK